MSCGGPTTENKIAESKEITGDQGAPFKYWTWITYNPKMTTEQYDELFKKFKGNGMDAVLVNTLTKPSDLELLVPIAQKNGIELHAWLMTMTDRERLPYKIQTGTPLAERENLVMTPALM